MSATTAFADLVRRDAADAAMRLVAADEPAAVALIQALERHLSAQPLTRLERVWDVSAAQAAAIFGISRQAYAKWRVTGVPADRRADVAALDTATEVLLRHVRVERIPAVVRRPAPLLGGRTLLEAAAASPREASQAVATMLDLRRVQP